MAREKLCLGIDIGSSSIKMCVLKGGGGIYTLRHVGRIELPSDAIVDGSIMNAVQISESMTELARSLGIKNKDAAIAISGHSVIIKKISFPRMSAQELERAVIGEAEQYIPFDIQDVYMDVQIVNENASQQGYMDVVLVAAKKDVVNEYTQVVRDAGFEPVICDVDPFAMETAFLQNYAVSPSTSMALIDMGAAKTSINVVSRGVSCFTRDLPWGGNHVTEEIQKRTGISRSDAEQIKRGLRLADDPDAVVFAMNAACETVADEIQRTFDFFSATATDPPPSVIYLFGGGANLSALQKALATHSRLPVEIADPFHRITIPQNNMNAVAELGPAATTAVGLALRYPGDS